MVKGYCYSGSIKESQEGDNFFESQNTLGDLSPLWKACPLDFSLTIARGGKGGLWSG